MNFLSFLLYIIPLRVNSVITIITTMVAIKRKKRDESHLDSTWTISLSEKIRRVRHFILDLRKKIRIPAANFFYPHEIYSNKRDRISRIPPSSLPHPLDEKLSHRDPVCYRSSTPLLEFLDNPVYRSGRSARHSKTISRVDLRLPYVCVRDES